MPRADACHTGNLVVEAGNLFRIVVDLINAGFNRRVYLLILIAQILVGRFKLVDQTISFTDQRLRAAGSSALLTSVCRLVKKSCIEVEIELVLLESKLSIFDICS
jgi:hypothetical protein